MKLRWALIVTLLQAATLFAIDAKELPEKYRKWFLEEVPYIISPIERQVFLSLSTDKDRDFFIEAFWAQRDPTPGTPTNEFRDEHYRRIQHANTYFIDQPMPGWRTDRGRVYIILGKPKTVEHFEETLETTEVEAWFYLGNTRYGFPAGFNVMFFKPHGMGGYRLYHPGTDGPQSLFRVFKGDILDREQIYEDLKEQDAVLAEYSLSLLVGQREDRLGASLSSELLLKSIETYPQKLIDPRYAEKVAKYKTYIESDYSLSYVECRYIVCVTRAENGRYFLNYAVEPKTLSIDQYEKKFFTSFKIYGKIEDTKKRLIYEFTKNHPLEFDQVTLDRVEANSLCLTDMFPIVPGDYTFTLLVKNTVSKEFSDLETKVHVPADMEKGAVFLDAMIVSKIEPLGPGALKPFQFGGGLPDLRPQGAYLRGSSLRVLFQLAGNVDGESAIRAKITKDLEAVGDAEKPLAAASAGTHYSLFLPTSELPAGEYNVLLEIVGTGGAVLASRPMRFSISPTANVPTPWVYSKVLPADKSYVYDMIVADQYARKGEEAMALPIFEEGVTKHPEVAEFGLGLSRVLLQKKEYPRVIEILSPLAAKPEQRIPEIFLYLATAQQATGQYAAAVENYNAYTNLHGTDYRVLNAIGECYLGVGQKDDALQAWQNSLKIYPDQPALKERIAKVK